jgi:Kef-type K+ transport system membrane component KefB
MMPTDSLVSLAAVLAVAFAARLVLGLVPRVRVPAPVVEIVLGIVIGPAVLGWARVDEPVRVLALVGLAVLLFLSGYELDLSSLRGPLARRAGLGLAASAVLALVVGGGLSVGGIVGDPLLVAVALLATSLGLVVPVLAENDLTTTTLGRVVLLGATLGDFAAVVLLSLLFSTDAAEPAARLALVGVFVAGLAVAAAAIAGVAHRMSLSPVLARLQDGTAQIRVRGTLLLVVTLAVLAERTGLEAILGAFVAGALVRLVDRDVAHTHPLFPVKLDAIGYGFVVPVFFVASGMRFDLRSLLASPGTLALVPLFVAALLVVRGLPVLVHRSDLGSDRALVGAGLLQATSLPLLVTAAAIGVESGALTTGVAAALVGAGLVSALVFPTLGCALARPRSHQAATGTDAVSPSPA